MYDVVANTGAADSTGDGGGSNVWFWLAPLIAVIAAGAGVGVFLLMRKKKIEKPKQ
jgi:hypothetical protein